MSNDILPVLESAQKVIEETKDQTRLTGALRVKALERELDQLNRINDVIDNVIISMEASSSNIDIVLSTTESSNKLLDLWIKILSQTSYTNSILSDKNWKGITKSEENYQSQLKKLDELQKRYNIEKQKRDLEKESLNQKRIAQERRAKEREESLRRRVYGNNSSRVSSSRDARSSSRTRSTKK